MLPWKSHIFARIAHSYINYLDVCASLILKEMSFILLNSICLSDTKTRKVSKWLEENEIGEKESDAYLSNVSH